MPVQINDKLAERACQASADGFAEMSKSLPFSVWGRLAIKRFQASQQGRGIDTLAWGEENLVSCAWTAYLLHNQLLTVPKPCIPASEKEDRSKKPATKSKRVRKPVMEI